MLKIIELGSLEDKVSGTKFLIMLFDPLPFVLVGTQTQDLQFNADRGAVLHLGFVQMLQAF